MGNENGLEEPLIKKKIKGLVPISKNINLIKISYVNSLVKESSWDDNMLNHLIHRLENS